jgi:hypothetical protein
MRALIVLAVVAAFAVGCEKTIKDVKNDRPVEPVAISQ